MREGLTYPAMFMEGGLANYFGPGRRYDVIWPANNNVEEKGGGGLMQIIDVE